MANIVSNLRNYLPNNWNHNTVAPITLWNVAASSSEFREIANEIRDIQSNLKYKLISLQRVQNIMAYGRYIITEQQKLITEGEPLYSVRRYKVIQRYDKDVVLQYNLDPRRFRFPSVYSLQFNIDIPNVNDDELIVLLKVISKTSNERCISPSRDNEFYIEYIAEVEYI